MKYISLIIFLILGGAIGYFSADILFNSIQGISIVSVCITALVSFVLSFYLSIIFHEGGHLLFGCLTGYSFLSFRVGTLTLLKEKDHFVFKRLNLAGTAGQCILSPPAWSESFPYILYNVGGVCMNIIVMVVSLFLRIFISNPYIRLFLIVQALVNAIMALSNGIPMNDGIVSNDGYNVIHFGKDKNALYGFYLQLLVNSNQMNGKRLKDMPEEWFEIEGDLKNPMVTTVHVFKENYYMDCHDFEKAYECVQFLLSDEVKILGLYEGLLKGDLLYLEILLDKEITSKIDSKFMKDFPSVLRTKFAYALYKGEDPKVYLDQFEKEVASVDKISDEERQKLIVNGDYLPSYMWNVNGWLCDKLGLTVKSQSCLIFYLLFHFTFLSGYLFYNVDKKN